MKRVLSILLLALVTITSAEAQKISKAELKDKIAGAWIGQMVGNIYGLPFENDFIDEPAPESEFPFGYTYNIDKLEKYDGAFSDDDTDIEYIYLMLMEKYGSEPTYANMREGWMYHIRDRVWLANRASLGLMHYGFTPPFTGAEEFNPHWFQIDPQLINEIWAYTAPGMPAYAAQKSDWAARITTDSWAVSPTVLYGAMYAEAFFCDDVEKLIRKALKYLSPEDRFAIGVNEMLELHKQYPNDWVKARQLMADKYYVNEPAMTKTIWNANLNGLCGVLAMLYGNGDFQRTLDLSCAMGYDCDNQAATMSGVLGVMYGADALPKDLTMPIEGWTTPFNDRYINITRYDMPDASIQDMIDRTYELAIQLVCENGGRVKGDNIYVNAKATFTPPMEFCVGPNPDLEIGCETQYSFAAVTNQAFEWALAKGTLPAGVAFNAGRLSGTPTEAGHFPITLSLSNGKSTITKDFDLLVKSKNIAPAANEIFANVKEVNKEVLFESWITFGHPMYADNVNVINDGIKNGVGSVYYSLAGLNIEPKIDFFGYGWDQEQQINMLVLNMGCLEEFGGWFTSLNIQYIDENGRWANIAGYKSTPELPETNIVFFQPHFAQFVLEFPTVKTTGIRIIMDTKLQEHWHKYTKNVTGFISITELGVYNN